MMILMKIKIFIEYWAGRAVPSVNCTIKTILQDQVTKFGDHIFKDGSKVSGASYLVLVRGK